MSLYEWRNVDTEAWDDLPAVHDTLVADGVLVPVEPDYEELLRLAADTIRQLAEQQAMPDNFYHGTLSRIDAALGIGETL